MTEFLNKLVASDFVPHSKGCSSFLHDQADGMGMGLSISRAIVEGYGGHLWPSMCEGSGAAFHLALPALP